MKKKGGFGGFSKKKRESLKLGFNLDFKFGLVWIGEKGSCSVSAC